MHLAFLLWQNTCRHSYPELRNNMCGDWVEKNLVAWLGAHTPAGSHHIPLLKECQEILCLGKEQILSLLFFFLLPLSRLPARHASADFCIGRILQTPKELELLCDWPVFSFSSDPVRLESMVSQWAHLMIPDFPAEQPFTEWLLSARCFEYIISSYSFRAISFLSTNKDSGTYRGEMICSRSKANIK